MSELMTLMSSAKREDWETPPALFAKWNDEFQFTLDPCCTAKTAKCARYFTPEIGGLHQTWAPERVFMNPPYGRNISRWLAKAVAESRRGALVVGLIFAKTETAWWHDYVIGGGAEIRFIRGRIQFYLDGVSSGVNAPFGSALVIWRPR